MSFISTGPERLTYFDLQLGRPDWRGCKVLDFGGNRGAMLSSGKIEEGNYWCVDLSRDAIELGQRDYPQAHWIFYDRYNFAYNPTGIPGLPVPLRKERFDFILAYSVFTHTSKEEMLELVQFLRGLLTDHGRLAFTFIDPHCVLPRDYSSFLGERDEHTNLSWRLETMRELNPDIAVDALLHQAKGARWCTLVNGCDLYIENERIKDYSLEQKLHYDTFYAARYIVDLFQEGVIAPCPANYDPGGSQMQHCCILR